MILAVALSACGWPEPQIREVDLAVAVDLHGVVYGDGLFAVGAGGVVVHEAGMQWEFGGVDLRGIDVFLTHRPNVAVVGDAGFVAFGAGDELEQIEWVELDAGTNADLRAVVILDMDPAQLLIVGEGVVLRGTEVAPGVFEWLEPLAPDGSWGALRALHLDPIPAFGAPNQGRELLLVGDEGRLLTSDIDAMVWVAHELDTDADLLCASARGAYGERGTWARPQDQGWAAVEIDPTIDYVACGGDLLVSSDRRVHDLDTGSTLSFDWQPHAVDTMGIYLVGEAGHAGFYDRGGPHEF